MSQGRHKNTLKGPKTRVLVVSAGPPLKFSKPQVMSIYTWPQKQSLFSHCAGSDKSPIITPLTQSSSDATKCQRDALSQAHGVQSPAVSV